MDKTEFTKSPDSQRAKIWKYISIMKPHNAKTLVYPAPVVLSQVKRDLRDMGLVPGEYVTWPTFLNAPALQFKSRYKCPLCKEHGIERFKSQVPGDFRTYEKCPNGHPYAVS